MVAYHLTTPATEQCSVTAVLNRIAKNFRDGPDPDAFVASFGAAMSVVGDSGRSALLFHLMRRSGVVLEDLLVRPEKVAEAMEELLGPGALILIRAIEANMPNPSEGMHPQ